MLCFSISNVFQVISSCGVILCACYMHLAEGQSFFEYEPEAESRDGYYDNETPKNWVDVLFLILISVHHLEYAFKFTDYSLSHVHIKQQRLANSAADDDEKANANLNQRDLQIKRDTGRTTMLQSLDVFEMFSTESDGATTRRPIHNRLCCCIRFSPRFFTWERTHVMRLILKLYCCISCLLAMVLYVLFCMNLLAEYTITCVVHWEDGYLAALLMMPFLLFACNILIRLSWQSVVASWSMSCDANGDLECSDSDVMITALRKQMVNRKRLLYTFTTGAREEYWEEDLERSQTEGTSQCEQGHDLSEVAEQAERDLHLSKMADYFIATCWRFGYFFYAMVFAVIASITLHVEVALNGFFWQLVMRYCVLAGVSWTIVYTVCSLFVAVTSRYRTWKTAHAEIPRYKLFFLIDAQDTEDSNKNWMRLKIFVMSLSLVLGFGMIIASYIFIDAYWSSFVHFCGIIWLLYYLANLFMSCKPYALVALWTDSIPPPGKNYLAHKIASHELHKKNMLKVSLASKSDVHKFNARNQANQTIIADDEYDDAAGDDDAAAGDDDNDVPENPTHPHLNFSADMIEVMIAHEPTNFQDNENEIEMQQPQSAANGQDNGAKATKTAALKTTMSVPNLSDDDVPDPERNPDDMPTFSDDAAGDGGAGGDEKLDVVVVDNLRSVQSTKRILNEKMQNDTTPREPQAREEASLPAQPTDTGTSLLSQPQQPIGTLLLNSTSGSGSASETPEPSGDAAEVVALSNKEKKLKTQTTFRSKRAESLERRYQAFKYAYVEVNPEDFMDRNLFLWCTNCKYQRAKAASFLENYQMYWLNVYRPFDEYDIESQIASYNLLAGFKWLKPILQWSVCERETNKRHHHRKKSCVEAMMDVFTFFMNNFCNLCIMVTVIFFMVGLFQTAQRLSGRDQFVEKVVYESNQTAFYGVCSDKFGALGHGESNQTAEYELSVLDVTVMTQIAYEASRYDLCETIDVYFNGTFKLVKINREEPFFFHIRHKSEPIDFIAIRGTSNLIEMMQDLSLYIEVIIYETLQWIVPFLNGLPVSFARQIIYYASYVEGVINSDVRGAFDEPVIQYAKEYIRRLESADCAYADGEVTDWTGPTTLYFVGHSLGGAISEIAAASLHEWNKKNNFRSHVQSFGVASPGVLYSSAKFGFGVEALDKTSSSVLPRRDLVSATDSHGGSIQYTECSADYFHTCHKTDNILCELFYGCPADLASGAKGQWLEDFCKASSGSNATLGKAQIGESIRRIGPNITKVIEWELDDITRRCDDGVYEFCNATNTRFLQTCSEDFSHWDLCFSESQLQ